MARRTHYSETQVQNVFEIYSGLEMTGHHRRIGTKKHIASVLGMDRTEVTHILDILKERGTIGDHHCLSNLQASGKGKASFYNAVTQDKLLQNIRSFRSKRTITPGTHKILCIPDAHASVDTTNERFAWVGKLAAERRPDIIVQIGDFFSFDSVSGHEKGGTIKFSKKPSFENEFKVCVDALRQFEAQLPKKYNPKKYVTFGNHEQRLYEFENMTPTCDRTYTARLEGLFEGHGWQWSPYGAKVYIEGVMFTHRPFNVMGKPEGWAAIKSSAMTDIYVGHDHLRFEETVVKQDDAVTVISGGCFMPDGYLPNYAQACKTGWWYGCQILTVEDGKITETEWISMKTLEKKYG